MATDPRNSTIIPISNKPFLTPFVFYEYLLPELHCLFSRDPSAVVTFDASKIDRISPLVLAPLLSVGEILKAHCGRPAGLHLGQNTALMEYLWALGFFRQVNKNTLYNYETVDFGGFDTSASFADTSVCERFYDPAIEKDDLALHLERVYGNEMVHYFGQMHYVHAFTKILAELLTNSARHGEAPGYWTVFGARRRGLLCSVSDSGIGFLCSLLKRDAHCLRLFSRDELLRKDGNEHLRGILEGVYRRVGSATYGISDTIAHITGAGGTVRIHSANTQIVFTQQNYARFAGDGKKRDALICELLSYFMYREKVAEGVIVSPLRRWNATFAGVHVEIDIPATEWRKERQL